MTATATTERIGARAARDVELPLQAIAEVALAAVTMAAVFGMRRAFVGTDWFDELAVQAIAAHALVTVLRRRAVSLPAATLAMGVAGLLAMTWIFAGETTAFGIPTGESLDTLSRALSDARAAFADVRAPTDALPGFLIASSGAIWIGAALADWAAFRADAALEATLPSATLFVLTAVLGADVDRLLISMIWILAVLAFLLVRRADQLGRTATWVGDRRRAGPRFLLGVGAALVAVAILVAAVVGPRIPGAESDAILSLTDIGDPGPGTRVTVSPLVDIRSRLVEQADVEVFAVRSSVRSYWRLTSLDRFDGRIWSSNGSYGAAEGDLDDGVPVASERITFEQSYAISALAQIWLPAAYEPRSVSAATDLRYDEVSGTIIVDTDIPTSDNTDYRVVSALPQHDSTALASASAAVPGDIADRYLSLPSDFPDSVRALAAELATGSGSAYGAALRLQDFFRTEFTYDLDVGAGHSDAAMERFVLDLRRGYCEQFAGSFAAMARSLGIPARVAVGFTPGNTTPADPTLYRVRGEHAHAWPEVYLGEYGWVMFEPTPGRGAPFTEQYTGVPEQQVTSGGDPTTATSAVSPPSTDGPAGPTSSTPGRDTRTPDELGTGDLDDAGREPSPSPWPGRLAWAAGLLVGAAVLYVVVVTTVTGYRRARRRRVANEPTRRVALAWEESVDAVRRAGIPIKESLTQHEVAAHVSDRLPLAEPAMSALANAVRDAAYSPDPTDMAVGERMLDHAAEVERAARDSMTTRERVRARLHPNRLFDR